MSVIKTEIFRDIPHNTSELAKASGIIKNGGTVVFPTETVYGLGADAFNERAVKNIFLAKGRPSDNPLIAHIAGIGDIGLAAAEVPEAAYFLFEKFSPGPLTLIMKKNERISKLTTAGLDTVAIRIPSHAGARALIRASGVPVAAPSANRSGRPSPTTFGMALKEMDGRADAIIDGGDCEIGLESTVILLDEKAVRIIRPGAITFEMVENALNGLGHGYKLLAPEKAGDKPLSPGLKYLHYKPKAEVYLTGGSDIEKIKNLFPGRNIGMIIYGSGKKGKTSPDPRVLRFGTLAEYAQGLYRGFTELDGLGCDIIIAQTVGPEGLGTAIMNRLIKASGGKSI